MQEILLPSEQLIAGTAETPINIFLARNFDHYFVMHMKNVLKKKICDKKRNHQTSTEWPFEINEPEKKIELESFSNDGHRLVPTIQTAVNFMKHYSFHSSLNAVLPTQFVLRLKFYLFIYFLFFWLNYTSTWTAVRLNAPTQNRRIHVK